MPRWRPRWASFRSGRLFLGLMVSAALSVLAVGPSSSMASAQIRGHERIRAQSRTAGRVRTAETGLPNLEDVVPLSPTAPAIFGSAAQARSPTAPGSGGSWSRPFTLWGPEDADLIPAVLAMSSTADRLAVGSGVTDEDDPNLARASVITDAASDRPGSAVAVSGSQQALALAYIGRRLVLLSGTSPAADACCSTLSTRTAADGHSFGAARPLISGLSGTTFATLVPVRGGLLAAVDNQSGVTVARSNAAGAFGPTEALAGTDPTPPLMAAGSLSGGGAVVVWTAPVAAPQTVTGTTTGPNGVSTTSSGYDQPANQLIEFSTAGPSGLPGSAKLAVQAPAGHQIDALAVIGHGRGATVAWTESWFAGARFRSEVFWADLRIGAQPRALSGPGTAAVGVSLAGSSGGRQVLAWQACAVAAGTCTADAALRPHGDAWTAPLSLGPADPNSFPVATQASSGQSLVGWTQGATVVAAAASAGAARFSAAQRVASISDVSSLALSFGPRRQAIAVWTQGTQNERLLAARFTSGASVSR